MGSLAQMSAVASRLIVKLVTEDGVIFPHSEFNIYWAMNELIQITRMIMDSH